MPQAEEKLVETIPFDVYAMMLVLSALATLAAVLVLNSELRQYWGAGEEPPQPHAAFVTTVNEPVIPGKAPEKETDWVMVNQQDKDDYKALRGKDLEVTEFPVWIDPLKNPVGLEPGAENKAPDELREKLKSDFIEKDDPTVEAPATKAGP